MLILQILVTILICAIFVCGWLIILCLPFVKNSEFKSEDDEED